MPELLLQNVYTRSNFEMCVKNRCRIYLERGIATEVRERTVKTKSKHNFA